MLEIFGDDLPRDPRLTFVPSSHQAAVPARNRLAKPLSACSMRGPVSIKTVAEPHC